MHNVAPTTAVGNFRTWSTPVDTALAVSLPVVAPATRPARDWVGIPRDVAPPMALAALLGVSTRCVLYWRRGQRRPRWRHQRKLVLLRMVLRRARA